MFHAVGLKAMDAKEIHNDCFEKSTAENNADIISSFQMQYTKDQECDERINVVTLRLKGEVNRIFRTCM